jgi:glucan phosphorylase
LNPEEMEEREMGMALHDGGLNSVAAFLFGSMDSLCLKPWRYGRRYQDVMLKQRMDKEGEQAELSDFWLSEGYP